MGEQDFKAPRREEGQQLTLALARISSLQTRINKMEADHGSVYDNGVAHGRLQVHREIAASLSRAISTAHNDGTVQHRVPVLKALLAQVQHRISREAFDANVQVTG